jgi:hypothetical protein
MLRHASRRHALTTESVLGPLALAPLPPATAGAFALPPGSEESLTLPAG